MNFTQEQKYEIILKEVKEKGFEYALSNSLTLLMQAERELHNAENGDVSNGYRLRHTYGSGKVLELRVPRTRNGGFKPLLLGILKSREQECREIAFELYSNGLTTEQVGRIFDKIYGRSYSTSSISKMFDYAREEVRQWQERALLSKYSVIYIDATFVSTRRIDRVSKEAYYVVLGIKEDATREVLGIYNNPTESSSFYQHILSDIIQRGVKEVSLFVSDGLSGIENVIWEYFPNADVQLCTCHFKRDCLLKAKREHKQEMAFDLKDVFRTDDSSDTPEKGELRLKSFCDKWGKYYKSIRNIMNSERTKLYFTYIKFDYRVRNMIYTTNYIERLNRDFKRTIKIRTSMPNEDSVLLLMCSVAMRKQELFNKTLPKMKYDNLLFSQYLYTF